MQTNERDKCGKKCIEAAGIQSFESGCSSIYLKCNANRTDELVNGFENGGQKHQKRLQFDKYK